MNWVGSINNTLVPKHPSSVPVWLHSSVGRLGQLSATGDLTYSIPEPHILLMLDRLLLVLSLIKSSCEALVTIRAASQGGSNPLVWPLCVLATVLGVAYLDSECRTRGKLTALDHRHSYSWLGW